MVRGYNPSPIATPAIKLAKLFCPQIADKNVPFPKHWPSPQSGLLPDCLHLEGLPMTDPLFIPLHEWWCLHFKDVMAPVPQILPPFKHVNHHIPLLHLNKQYLERWATCPQALKGQL